ncbi:hypothetical protein, partial [uncultured Cyclobacterium sp.]|uniref:hypothetical protein n=1 Tax=uncultured Cyclobacterium sp. TaxID=453820 RepID=UPI0030EFA314
KIRTENKHLRNCSEEERLYAEHVASGDFQPERELSRDQLMAVLNHQFESLPKDQRLSIYLTYFYDLSFELRDALGNKGKHQAGEPVFLKETRWR